MRSRIAVIGAVLAASLAAVPAAAAGRAVGPVRSATRASGPDLNWTTYHGNAARTGTVAGLPAAGRLFIRWSRPLDGAVYGQPLVLGRVVIAATEHDTVYGLSRRTGRVLWRRHVASPLPLSSQPCGNIDPLGITSTPVYDPSTHLVYALAQDGPDRHVLVGLRPATGAVKYRRFVPSPDGRPFYDQQRGALAYGSGRIYVVFGGHFGDCGPYIGSVVGMPDHGRAVRVAYRVPAKRLAGIWATPGPVINARGNLYVSVGNGSATSPPYDGSDSVTWLSPRLRRIGLFAPARWASDNAADLDLGSTSPALLPNGLMLAVGKSGTGYLLRASHLGGIGGQIFSLRVCSAWGGDAVSHGTVYVPCGIGGLAAVKVAHGRARVLWRGPASASGSPVVGGGAVWVLNVDAGVLYEVGRLTGQVRHSIRLGSVLPHFASPSLSGRLIIIGTMRGVVAVSGA